MSFFDSDIVKAEMADIHQLQEEIYSSVMNFPYMSAAVKTEHINLLSQHMLKTGNSTGLKLELANLSN